MQLNNLKRRPVVLRWVMIFQELFGLSISLSLGGGVTTLFRLMFLVSVFSGLKKMFKKEKTIKEKADEQRSSYKEYTLEEDRRMDKKETLCVQQKSAEWIVAEQPCPAKVHRVQ